MAPKKAASDVPAASAAPTAHEVSDKSKKRKAPAASTGSKTKQPLTMTEREYFLFCALRTVTTKSDAKVDWELVREATGATTKAHALYQRYWHMCGADIVVGEGRDLPDLAEILGRAKGAVANTKAVKAKTVKNIGDHEEDAGDDVEKEKPKNKRAKAATKTTGDVGDEEGGEPPKKMPRARKVKAAEVTGEDKKGADGGNTNEKPKTKKSTKLPDVEREEAPKWDDRHCSDLDEDSAIPEA